MEQGEATAIVEWAVLAMVLVATVGLGFTDNSEKESELQVSNISGTVILSTPSALETLGYEGYKIGSLATVDLEVNPVVSEGCSDCSSPPEGIRVNGSVVITELYNEAGHLLRVEGQLSMIHLQEKTGDFITREWLSIDWKGGDISSYTEVMVVHDPPRWQPDGRYQASFVPVAGGLESRTGPWVFVDTLLETVQDVRGCLPDSFTCDSTSRPDVELTSTFSQNPPAWHVQHPADWIIVEDGVNGTFWCDAATGEALDKGTEDTSEPVLTNVVPMGLWLEALGLPSLSIQSSGGIWSEVEYDDHSCSTMLDESGVMRLGISSR